LPSAPLHLLILLPAFLRSPCHLWLPSHHSSCPTRALQSLWEASCCLPSRKDSAGEGRGEAGKEEVSGRSAGRLLLLLEKGDVAGRWILM